MTTEPLTFLLQRGFLADRESLDIEFFRRLKGAFDDREPDHDHHPSRRPQSSCGMEYSRMRMW